MLNRRALDWIGFPVPRLKLHWIALDSVAPLKAALEWIGFQAGMQVPSEIAPNQAAER